MKAATVLRWGLRLAVGGLMGWAGLQKLADPRLFAAQIAAYRLLPAVANQILAVTLPWVELGVGVMLIVGLWVRPAALAASFLMTVFAAAVLSALARGLDIECGCFDSGSGTRIGLTTLAIEGALLAASVMLFRLAGRVKRTPPGQLPGSGGVPAENS